MNKKEKIQEFLNKKEEVEIFANDKFKQIESLLISIENKCEETGVNIYYKSKLGSREYFPKSLNDKWRDIENYITENVSIPYDGFGFWASSSDFC